MCASALPLAIFGFSGSELVIVFLIVLLLFGGAKLPQLARGLGQSIKEFKKASREDDEAKPANADPAKPAETKKQDNNTPTHGTN